MSNIDKLTKLVGQSLTEGFMLGCLSEGDIVRQANQLGISRVALLTCDEGAPLMLGLIDGTTLGSPLGAELGIDDGSIEMLGFSLGCVVGQSDTLGLSLGIDDGWAEMLGLSLGRLVGLSETLGSSLGMNDGILEVLGFSLGCDEGSADTLGFWLG